MTTVEEEHARRIAAEQERLERLIRVNAAVHASRNAGNEHAAWLLNEASCDCGECVARVDVKYECPIHHAPLHEQEQYPGAWLHDGCPNIYTPIDGHLCWLDHGQWRDVKSNEVRIALPSKS